MCNKDFSCFLLKICLSITTMDCAMHFWVCWQIRCSRTAISVPATESIPACHILFSVCHINREGSQGFVFTWHGGGGRKETVFSFFCGSGITNLIFSPNCSLGTFCEDLFRGQGRQLLDRNKRMWEREGRMGDFSIKTKLFKLKWDRNRKLLLLHTISTFKNKFNPNW